ncbi:DUF5590 domain-containing protein [Lacticaseibacillus nasuensis]|uniref:cell wall elongation regulator TseB-like domain-containing protein n=1 Tax=Lacticaseibacillus nasuensis TaxID=944671 RepID=UPI00070536EC|nr:DUF5590 domain-containing protein [Lacticaseibacillus nasuensis]
MRQARRSKWPQRLALAGGVALILVVVGIYLTALAPLHQVRKEAIHIAETKAGVTQVDQFYWDRQRQSYLCVAGTTKDQTRVYVLIRQKTGKVTLLRQAAGISASTARKQAVAAFAPKKVLSVGLSRRGKNVVWDVGYESKSGKLGYVTYDFKTGDQLKAIANL